MKGTLYCDESGFSGTNLFLDAEPNFVYASLAIEPGRATELAEQVKSDANVRGELKFGKLLGRPKGPHTITKFLTKHVGAARIFVAHKRYATAGKFFEYVFEPVLADQSSLFYSIGFHRYVSNLLYASFASREGAAEELLADAQMLIKNRDTAGLKRLLRSPDGSSADDDAITAITTFAAGYRHLILEEIASLNEHEEIGRWVMDLTSAALFVLVRSWGLEYEELKVICDESKPLKVNRECIAVMVAAELDQIVRAFGGPRGRAVRLPHSIELVSDKRVPGLQLADLIAGATRYALANQAVEPACLWLGLLTPHFDCSISPDSDAIAPGRKETQVNEMILHELAQRAGKGQDPLKGMPALIKEFGRTAT